MVVAQLFGKFGPSTFCPTILATLCLTAVASVAIVWCTTNGNRSRHRGGGGGGRGVGATRNPLFDSSHLDNDAIT
jgi:hypothetical protein